MKGSNHKGFCKSFTNDAPSYFRWMKQKQLCYSAYRFQEHHSMKRSLKVQVVTTGDLTIEFCSSRELEEERLLCRLEMELPPPSRDIEVSALIGRIGSFFPMIAHCNNKMQISKVG